MPSFERGVYEPKSDDVRVFDEDEQDIDEEGSRLPLLIVIALLVLAAFGGVVWLAYSQGVQRGRADAPRMIVAATGPTKEAAAEPSDATRSLKIYQQPAPADDETDNAPPPPSEAAKPAATPMAVKPKVAAPVVAKPGTSASKPETKPAATAMKPAQTEPKPVVTKSVETKPAETKPVTKPVETAALPPPAGATAAPAETKPVEAASAGGAYVLQIGAYKSQEDADTAWKSFKSKHPIAGGYSEDVRKADLGDKGTWYRLRIGSFGDKAAASSFCDKLKADGGSCLIAK
jgi:cell division protein FtsN